MADAGYAFDIDPADVDETPLADESARRYVERLARNKAEVIAHRHPEATVLGADTIVTVDGVLLGKPADDTEAAAMLFRLSGRSHEVMTGVAVALQQALEYVAYMGRISLLGCTRVSDAAIDFLQIEQRLNDTHCGTSFRIQLIKITYERSSLPTPPRESNPDMRNS